jgi:hypothetical protein
MPTICRSAIGKRKKKPEKDSKQRNSRRRNSRRLKNPSPYADVASTGSSTEEQVWLSPGELQAPQLRLWVDRIWP